MASLLGSGRPLRPPPPSPRTGPRGYDSVAEKILRVLFEAPARGREVTNADRPATCPREHGRPWTGARVDTEVEGGSDSSKVSIVLLNYNTHGLVLDCLRSMRNLRIPDFEVVLLDNGSREFDPRPFAEAWPGW